MDSHRLSRVLGKDARTLDIQSKQAMNLSVRSPVIYTVLGSRAIYVSTGPYLRNPAVVGNVTESPPSLM